MNCVYNLTSISEVHSNESGQAINYMTLQVLIGVTVHIMSEYKHLELPKFNTACGIHYFTIIIALLHWL